MRLIAFLLAFLAAPVAAQEVVPVPYDELRILAPNLLDFDRLPPDEAVHFGAQMPMLVLCYDLFVAHGAC